MIEYFKKTSAYLSSLNMQTADRLDKKASELLSDEVAYERASQALRRRFSRGAEMVEGIDRGGRRTTIKRERINGTWEYSVQGANNQWFKPEERIWVVSMYALWQDTR
jgi:hypothetical protein